MPVETHAEQTLRTCPDCGWSGTTNYCGNCGEEMEPYIPKFGQFFSELLSEIVSFDSRVVRTIPALLFRPGFLTKEYLAGRRKRYLLPWRLYFLVGLFSFFILGTVFHEHVELKTHGNTQTFEFGDASQTVGTPTAPDPNASRNGKIFFSYLMEITPYVILIGSVPLFALILRLLYLKQKLLYASHLIFSFHFFAFAVLIFIVSISVDPSTIHIGILLLFFIYLFFALRKAYDDRGFGLVIRFLASSVFYFIVIAIGIIVSAIAAHGIASYLGKIPKLSGLPF